MVIGAEDNVWWRGGGGRENSNRSVLSVGRWDYKRLGNVGLIQPVHPNPSTTHTDPNQHTIHYFKQNYSSFTNTDRKCTNLTFCMHFSFFISMSALCTLLSLHVLKSLYYTLINTFLFPPKQVCHSVPWGVQVVLDLKSTQRMQKVHNGHPCISLCCLCAHVCHIFAGV